MYININTLYEYYNYGKTFIRTTIGGLERKIFSISGERNECPRPPRFVYDDKNGLKIYVDLQEFLKMPPNKQMKYKRIETNDRTTK